MENIRHTWANEIIAWALGKPTQFRVLKVDYTWSDWIDCPKESGWLNWDNPDVEFRIKPIEK